MTEYRDLEVGERLEAGDQYRVYVKWHDITLVDIGTIVDDDCLIFRRPLEVEEEEILCITCGEPMGKHNCCSGKCPVGDGRFRTEPEEADSRLLRSAESMGRAVEKKGTGDDLIRDVLVYGKGFFMIENGEVSRIDPIDVRSYRIIEEDECDHTKGYDGPLNAMGCDIRLVKVSYDYAPYNSFKHCPDCGKKLGGV